MKSILAVFVLLFSVVTLAGLEADFETIKNWGRSQEATGTICEDIAQLRFMEKYPAPEYTVLTGISYSDKDRTLGELDVIVFNNSNHVAEIVAEVKCWKSPKSGLHKAHENSVQQSSRVYGRGSKRNSKRWL